MSWGVVYRYRKGVTPEKGGYFGFPQCMMKINPFVDWRMPCVWNPYPCIPSLSQLRPRRLVTSRLDWHVGIFQTGRARLETATCLPLYPKLLGRPGYISNPEELGYKRQHVYHGILNCWVGLVTFPIPKSLKSVSVRELTFNYFQKTVKCKCSSKSVSAMGLGCWLWVFPKQRGAQRQEANIMKGFPKAEFQFEFGTFLHVMVLK